MSSVRHAKAPVRRRDLRSASAPSRRAGRRPGTPRHAEVQRGHRHRWRVVALAIVGVLAFTGTAAGALYSQLQGSVEAIDPADLLPDDPDGDGTPNTPEPPVDPNAGTPLNLLVIGSDSRADGAVQDGETSVLADTHIVVHVSADRSRVELVSIPRDIMVDIPGCKTTSGEVIPPWFGQYNEAYAIGWQRGEDKTTAVACDVALAQSVTGLSIDGFVLVEMGGFVEMVDALGGVEICIPEPINVTKIHLELEAGCQVLDGPTALKYARARVGIGDGTDTGRIERQQHLMSAMVEDVLSRNLLSDGPKLYRMLEAALSSLTVSQNLSSLTDLAGLALSLRSLDTDDVTFMTTPYAGYAPDPNRLVFTGEVEQIWERMADDEPIVDPDTSTCDDAESGTDDIAADDGTGETAAGDGTGETAADDARC